MTRWEWSNLVLSADGPDSPTVRLVLVALLTFVNEAKGYAWPGVDKIQERSGFKSVRTVQEALGEAEGAGWLRRDAKPGHVTLYYPAIKGQTIALTPALVAGAPPQLVRGPPQETALTPAPNAGESCRESNRESRRWSEPTCPLCSAPMELKTPRRKGVPQFWGCTSYKATGCEGKRELDWDATAPSLAAAGREARRQVLDAMAQKKQEDVDGLPHPIDDPEAAVRLAKITAIANAKVPLTNNPKKIRFGY